jgi:uncharacterized protein with gpF-like domain
MPIILPPDAKKAVKKVRAGTPIRPPRSVEVDYRRALFELHKTLQTSTQAISAMVNAGAPREQTVAAMQREIARTTAAYDIAKAKLPDTWTLALSAINKRQIENMVAKSLGVDYARIVDDPAVKGALDMARVKNVELISSIPKEHWGRVIQAVDSNYRGIPLEEGSLTAQLRKIGDISENRARFIARDQTSKLAGDLTGIRQTEAGIDEYKWRNSQDARVVGNPGGLYPKGNAVHNNHWNREGKTYSWKKPPEDGNPGHAPGCRCRGEPIIDLDKLNAQFI